MTAFKNGHGLVSMLRVIVFWSFILVSITLFSAIYFTGYIVYCELPEYINLIITIWGLTAIESFIGLAGKIIQKIVEGKKGEDIATGQETKNKTIDNSD